MARKRNGHKRIRKLWMYVFAYGSNLDYAQMKRRCPSARPIGAGLITGYRLAFVGFSRHWGGAVATVIPDLDSFVVGMVYAISFRDLAVLDACEGAPHVYRRDPALVQMLGSEEEISADCYSLDRRYGFPSTEYVDTIRRGFRRWGFDPDMLDRAVRLSKHRAIKQLEALEREARYWKAQATRLAPGKCTTIPERPDRATRRKRAEQSSAKKREPSHEKHQKESDQCA